MKHVGRVLTSVVPSEVLKMFPDVSKLRALLRLRMGLNFVSLTCVVLTCLVAAATPMAHAQISEVRSTAPIRVVNPINDRDLVPLAGNVRRDLTPDRDLGPVEDSMPLHLYMVLKRTPEQQADLDYLIARQQERTAAEYHKWLTPKEFGARFGAHPNDIATLSSWLQQHGMEVRSVLNNASIIDVAVTAGQIRDTFHTEMHYFSVAGGKYAANVAEPQIPAALAPVVAGIEGMVKIPQQSNETPIGSTTYDKDTNTWHRVISNKTDQLKPDFRSGTSNDYYVAPQDLYTIYNINPILSGGNLAQTATVAVVEQNDFAYGTVNSTTGAATGGDVATFRSTFAVPGTLNMHVYHGYGTVTCTDPGIIAADGAQAVISAEWANATAPSANLVFMSCDDSPDSGALTSLLAVIDNNLADVISLGYTESESVATASTYSFMDMAEAEAATQGQSIFVAAGNAGSAEEDQGTTTVAANGINVSADSSPLVTVVGATDFQDVFDTIHDVPLSKYWATTNGQGYADARSYIPETAWNDSCASIINSLYETTELPLVGADPDLWCARNGTADNGTVRAGGGGISTHYAVPAWQAGIPGYSGTYRASPDISSFGSDGTIYSHALLVCDSAYSFATCTTSATTANFGISGGTSVVAPYLAGVAGLLVTSTGSRQGLLNPTLYALAKAQYTNSPTSCYANGQAQNDEFTEGLPAASCIFNDVTTGGNDVPCTAGSADCVLAENGAQFGLLGVDGATPDIPNAYASTPEFDEATGIGSVNVTNLITNWDTVFTSATALTATLTDITPSESTTLKAKVTGVGATGDTTPPVATGTVTFKAGTTTLGTCTLSDGSCTHVVDGTSLASGSNSITATFSGSPLYPSSTSSVLTVTVGSSTSPATLSSPASGSTLAGSTVTFTWTTGTGVSEYDLHVGTTGAGSSNIFGGTVSGQTKTVTGIPTTGGTLNVRLYSLINGAWQDIDYTFTESSGAAPATITSPASGSKLTSSAVTFAWTTGTDVTQYDLHVGTTGAGSSNIFGGTVTGTSKSVTGIPTSGGTLNVRLYSLINGAWQYVDYTYTEASAAAPATMSSPTPGSTLTGSSATFTWTTGSLVTEYDLHVGTTGAGSSNIFGGTVTGQTKTVTGIPTTGGTLNVRLYSLIAGAWQYVDYTYMEQ